jgi:glyoxylase-like metal-dependent hydrolase (beta-lactamase superfamily II)
VKIHSIELRLVNDGLVHVDAGGPFGLVPRRYFRSHLSPDVENRIPMSLHSLLVQSDGKWVLIDTGLGPKLTSGESDAWGLDRSEGGLLDQLRREEIRAGDVDIVINTHLHCDHCGGNTLLKDGVLEPAFPNAIYYVQRMEWAEAANPNPRTKGTYFEQNFAPLVQSGQMQLLHGDTSITKHVRCVVTPGHTRGHQSVVLEDGGWSGMFLGDLATMSLHMVRTSWATAYDIDPQQTISTKRLWQKWALEKDAWLFFQHDPKTKIAQLIKENGRFSLKPVEKFY